MQTYWLKNQFPQSVGYFEKNYSANDASLEDLYYYCISLYEIRNFEKLSICRNLLFSRSKDISSIGRTSKDAILAEIHSFYARNLIALGTEMSAVQKEVDFAVALLSNAPTNYHNGFKIPEIHVYETAGILSALRGDYVTALDYIMKIKGVTSFAEHQLRPIKNAAIAEIYFIMKDYGKARKVIEEYSGSPFINFANALAKVMILPLFIHYADVGADTSLNAWEDRGNTLSEFMLSKIFFETGELEEARKGYEKLLTKNLIVNYERLHWNVLADLALIYKKKGDTEKSISLLRESIVIIENHRKTIFSESSKMGFVGDKQKVYHQIILALFLAGRYVDAFEYVERSKSRALVDLLASNREFVTSKDKEQVAFMLKELETIEAENKAIDVSSLALERSNQRTIRGVEIKEKIKAAAPELHSLVTVSTLPPNEIQSNINSDETLIEYYYFGDDLYAFILTKDILRAVKLDSLNLVEDVEQFRKSLEDPKEKYIGLSQKLYQRLIKPIEHLINTPKLIIVPHGVLHYLPFNALNSGSNYLIDKYSINFLPSASVMKFLKLRKTQKTESALIFGNPDLDDPKYDLKFAEEEAVAISNELPNAKVLLRKEATETDFKKSASQFNYIHLATHGMFESDSPLNSGLFLTKDTENDGVLSVNELYSISLNADLVTLSACETALGKINPGDDVVGLQRGFLYAGSNSIVASLWKVDDMATSQLMTEFYSNLKKTNKRDALREAQLAVKKQYEHPYFWAAFQLTGMPE